MQSILQSIQHFFRAKALLLLVFCGVAMVSSCTVVRFHHVGKAFPPASTIDVVYAQRDLKVEKYEFIGEILMEVNNGYITPDMEYQLVQEARERGANAVIVGNLDIRYVEGNGIVYAGIGVISSGDQVARIVRGYLVRYL
jgi:hypothetical protein